MKHFLTTAAALCALFTASFASAAPTDREAAELALRAQITADANEAREARANSSRGYRVGNKECPAGRFCPVEDLYDPATDSIVSGVDLYAGNSPEYWRILRENRVMCRGVPNSPPRVLVNDTISIIANARFRSRNGSVRLHFSTADMARNQADRERQALRLMWGYAREHCGAVEDGDRFMRSFPLPQEVQ